MRVLQPANHEQVYLLIRRLKTSFDFLIHVMLGLARKRTLVANDMGIL